MDMRGVVLSLKNNLGVSVCLYAHEMNFCRASNPTAGPTSVLTGVAAVGP